jgi:hypothetical protein
VRIVPNPIDPHPFFTGLEAEVPRFCGLDLPPEPELTYENADVSTGSGDFNTPPVRES